MSGYLFTDEERQRFADYLDHDADQDDALQREMMKLGGAAELMAREKRQGMIAKRWVARWLRAAESFTVKGAGQ